jgi:hypothetical protein
MSRIAKKSAVVLLVVLLGVELAPALAPGQGGQPPLVPPQSHAFGKSFEQWNVLYSDWAIASGLGGATDLSHTLGQVRFLPADSFDRSLEFHVTLPPGTPFVAPALRRLGRAIRRSGCT